MKTKIILCLAFVAFNLSSQARVARGWSDTELMEASDLVVVGQPIDVKDLNESNSLGWDKSMGWLQLTFRGVETTFKVSEVLKGMPASDQIVLHHYRFDKINPPNGPTLVEFTPGDTNAPTSRLMLISLLLTRNRRWLRRDRPIPSAKFPSHIWIGASVIEP